MNLLFFFFFLGKGLLSCHFYQAKLSSLTSLTFAKET